MRTTRWLGTAVAVTGLAAGAALGVAVAANAAPAGAGQYATTGDAGCDLFGWRHPMCAGGAWGDDDESASQEWGPADTPNPVTPGGDTSMTFPGSPNTP